MNDKVRTKAELLEEISLLNKKIRKLEKNEKASKLAEKNLRNRETSLSAIIENQPWLFWLKDTQSRFLAVNQAFAASCGKQNAQELVGKTDLDIWPRELAEKYRRDDLKVMALGIATMVEEPIHDKGETRWFETFKTPVFGEQGIIIGTTGYARDITDRKLAEEKLRESEEKYRSILESIEDGYFEVDLAGNLAFVNDKLCKDLGYSRDELMGMNYRQYTDETTAIKEYELYNKLYRTSKPITDFAGEYIKKDGTRVFADLSVSLIRDAEGKPVGFRGLSRDKTEHKRIEETLLESEAKLQAIFNTVGTGIVIIDRDSQIIIEANQTALQMTGLPREKMIGRICHSVVCPALEGKCPVKDLGQNVDNSERKLICADGRRKDILKTVYPLTIKGRDCYIESFIDISDRLRAEELLRENEERFHQLFDNVADGVAIYRAVDDGNDFIFVDINSTGQLLSSTSRGDAVGKRVTEVFPAVVEIGLLDVFRSVWRTGEAEHHPSVLYKDGRIQEWVENYVFKLPSGLIVAIYSDTSEKRRAEEALRESQEIYSQFMENSPIYIFFKDENLRAILLSRNFEKMLGRPLQDMLGKTMDELFPSAFAQKMLADDLRILKEGKQISIEEEFNGRLYTTIKFPIQYGGKPRYLAGYTIDITERRQIENEKHVLEDRLNRAEKMEALGTLAGGVAHDLNNVLGIVVGYAEMLLVDLDKSSPLRLGLTNVMEGGQRAAAIVQDLLTLTRRGVSGRKVLNLNKIITDFQNSPEFEKLSSYNSAVRVETDLDCDLLNVSGSSVHLSKTLFNLVSNASEAMPKGGILAIRTTNQYLDKPIHGYDEVREGDYVVLTVTDNGEGIPDADLKRIFEPFYTKKVMGRSGTGLGLAVVWGTVKDHNGYIDVQSEEGEGSKFTLYFPVTREDLTAEEVAVSVSEYMGKGETILVVDDVEGQRDLAAGMLKKLNYSVTSVGSGEEAIAYLQDHSADLIVLDMIMDPGMDGLDTYRNILKIHPRQKAVIVSGYSETYRVAAAQALGSGAYVRKPYMMEKIGIAIRGELMKGAVK